jgi:hypothetical protein
MKTLKKNKATWPPKYYRGLTKKKQQERRKEIVKFSKRNWKDPKAYVGFQTDKGVKTKKSSYTAKWYSLFPHAKSLEEKAKATGVPLRFIKESYNRGMAAWRTGHRPGATEQAWGYARVHSFLVCGKTYETTDSDLAREAIRTSKTAKKWFARC